MKTFVHIFSLRDSKKSILRMVEYICSRPKNSGCYIQAIDKDGGVIWCMYPGFWEYADMITWNGVVRVEVYIDSDKDKFGQLTEDVYADSQKQVDIFMRNVRLHNSDYIEVAYNSTNLKVR